MGRQAFRVPFVKDALLIEKKTRPSERRSSAAHCANITSHNVECRATVRFQCSAPACRRFACGKHIVRAQDATCIHCGGALRVFVRRTKTTG
jgi:hypothetical protein